MLYKDWFALASTIFPWIHESPEPPITKYLPAFNAVIVNFHPVSLRTTLILELEIVALSCDLFKNEVVFVLASYKEAVA